VLLVHLFDALAKGLFVLLRLG
jgi:hypothetical protein